MYNIDLLHELNKGKSDSLITLKGKMLEIFENESCPKWKRLRYSLDTIPSYKPFNTLNIESDNEGIEIQRIDKLKNDLIYQSYSSMDKEYGIDKKLVALSELFCNSGVLIHIPRNKKTKPIHIKYKMDKENSLLLEHNIIIAKENSETEIFIEYDSDTKEELFRNGITKIYADKNAIVKLVKLQTLGDKVTNFDANVSVIKDNGEIDIIHCDVGAKVVGSDYTSYLEGKNSTVSINGIYIGDGENKIDLSYKAYHEGQCSNSNMEVRGLLKDCAKKVFRGTLDFKKGSKLSKGREKEIVIMLDESVVSHGIPALQCGEDDVEGEHAVSAGQIDQEQLFYIMSRGFTDKEAKRIIVESNFEPIVQMISNNNIKGKLKERIQSKLIDNED
ncbi:Fe-S cluster assembly protein SufD [Clostridiaceae bacterium M8S5]|nr:Fe-S cluster assembly protein SufD [Clostridiaceae bacterium M8S5]